MATFLQVCGLDPVRLLLTLGANPSLVDHTHGNTALHWAILARNSVAINTLVLKSRASLDVPNLRGETPATMLDTHSGAVWISAKVMNRVRETLATSRIRGISSMNRNTTGSGSTATAGTNSVIHNLLYNRSSLVALLKHDKRLRWWSMVACPFTAFYLAGVVFTINTLYIVKLFLLTCLYAVFYMIGKTLFDEHLMSLLPLSVYLATKAWFYITWFMYVVDTVSFTTSVAFLLCSVGLWICFLKSWRGDPGIINPTMEQRFKVTSCLHPLLTPLEYCNVQNNDLFG